MKSIIAVFASLAVAAAACAGGREQENSGMKPGGVMFHTLRNAPKITRGGEPVKIAMEPISADGLKIECGKGQYASMKFSNSVVVSVGENSSLEIEKFAQAQPFNTPHSAEKETTNSDLRLKLERGKIDAVSKELRVKSRFSIKTRAGEFSMKSKMFRICDNGEKIEITVIDGQATFKSNKGNSDFIRNRQKAFVKTQNTGAAAPLDADLIGLQETAEISAEIAPCKQIADSIIFYFDESGKLGAKRVIFREFLLKQAKYEYRN